MEVYVVKTHNEDESGICESNDVAVTRSHYEAYNIALSYMKDMEDKWLEDYDEEDITTRYDDNEMSLFHNEVSLYYLVTITKFELD